jgi:ABC-2 type transport system permease protein
MTRLLAAEVRRIAARRLVRVTLVLMAVAVVAGGVLMFAKTGTLSAQQRERIESAQQTRASIDECLAAHGIGPGVAKEITKEIAEACHVDTFVERPKDPRFYWSRLKGVLQGVSGVLAIVAWTLAASLIGAEFSSRSMTTLLTWVPGRARVFVAKAVTIVVAMSLVATLTLVITALAMVPALVAHGAPRGLGDPSVWTLAGVVGRGTALAAIAAALGSSIASIGRNTAAALGAGFAYIIVFENVVGSFVERWRRWLLLGNVIVFVSGENGGADVPGRTVTQAGLFLAAVGVAFIVGAYGAFRTRDIA